MIPQLKTVDIDITERCNLHCKHCIAECKSGVEELPKEKINSILDDMFSMGCRDLIIAGGEPFCHKDLFEVLNEAESRGIRAAILTNGILLNEERIEKLDELINIAYVRISMEYSEPSRYDSFRGTKNGIERITWAIRELKNIGKVVGINVVLFPDNLGSLDKVLDYAISNNVDFIRMVPVVGMKGVEPPKPSFYVDALKRVMKVIVSRSDHIYPYITKVPTDLTELSKAFPERCPGGRMSCSVSPSGFIKSCPMISDSIENSYNIYKMSLKEAWENLSQSANEEEEYFNKNAKGNCLSCGLKTRCLGGCKVEKLSRGLSIEAGQPVCVQDVINQAVGEGIEDPSVRYVLSNILTRQYGMKEYNVMQCFRSLPVWVYNLV